jgi:uncharacterized protein YcgI (DUF1989 family)
MIAISRLHIIARGGVVKRKTVALSQTLTIEAKHSSSLSTKARNISNPRHDARNHIASSCAKPHRYFTMAKHHLIQPLDQIGVGCRNVVIKIRLN